jgi:site-specific recombinase XerD
MTLSDQNAAAADGREPRVVALWRASGRTSSTIIKYLSWARSFCHRCAERGWDDVQMLTEAGVAEFVRIRARRGLGAHRAAAFGAARSALRAWAFALKTLGYDVPPWRPPPAPRPVAPLLAEFAEYRRRHGGVTRGTIRLEIDCASSFLTFVRDRGRRVRAVRLVDTDAFVAWLLKRMKRRTVAGRCSALRAFLRFLHSTGRLPHDIAGSVLAPRIRAADRPPRVLPWRDVRRLLAAIDVRLPLGRRDFALLLMMASYGMGAGEVLGLRLEDIDWRAGILHVRRPKTRVAIDLPLLPAVARALAAYLQHGRPAHTTAREVFVSAGIPHAALQGAGAIAHRIRKHARKAGVTAAFLGSHVLRHSHATRQIELGASVKAVGDILGHRDPSSTSAYVRVATTRLRSLALPMPR